MPSILPPCKLLEFDFSGIEAVILGWYAARLTDNPMGIRFGKLGPHALVASHLVGKPPDLSLPDQELAAYFKSIKKGYPAQYEPAKRTVHGTGYGMTPEGMTLMFPDIYHDLKHAQKVQGVYFSVFPMVPAFQLWVKKRMADKNRLGGAVQPGLTILTDMNAHVFTYEHEFYNVVEYRKLSPAQAAAARRDPLRRPFVIDINGVPHLMRWGPDSKRGLAFYPQSTARGVLAEAEIELFLEEGPTFIGRVYYGRTPLRGPIHDSLFLEVPFRKVDQVVESVATAMRRPIEEMPLKPEWGMGDYLTIGVEAKIGDDWEAMEEIKLPDVQYETVAGDGTYFPAEEAEEEDVAELRTAVA